MTVCVASECATHINTKYVLLRDIHVIYNVNEINISINVSYKNHRQIKVIHTDKCIGQMKRQH
jgi:hypothetical protein